MFTFKDVHISTYGAVLTLPPIKRAKKRTTLVQIDMGDTTLREDLGFESYILSCEVMLTDNSKIDDFMAHMMGYGKLVFDNDPDKYLGVWVDDSVEIDLLAKGSEVRTAKLDFLVLDPFRYKLNDPIQIFTTSPSTITNVGTYESAPIIKLTGSGTVNFTLAGQTFTYVFDTPYVIIDCNSKNCVHGTTYKNRRMTGDFPTLPTGTSQISWTGTLTEVAISPRTRYL